VERAERVDNGGDEGQEGGGIPPWLKRERSEDPGVPADSDERFDATGAGSFVPTLPRAGMLQPAQFRYERYESEEP
jgi:hypothetical protein